MLAIGSDDLAVILNGGLRSDTANDAYSFYLKLFDSVLASTCALPTKQ